MSIPGRVVMAMLLVWCAGVSTQAQPNASATVSFVLDFPASDPSHYSIEVSEDGKTVYASEVNVSRESDEKDSFRLEFVTSAATRQKIFDLARKANYFQGQLEANKKN